MVNYYMKSSGGCGGIYSCDKLVLSARLRGVDGGALLKHLERALLLQYKHWNSWKIGTFREQFSVQCENGESFWLGVGLNTFSRPDHKAIRLEFNPNKVADTHAFRAVWAGIVTYRRGRLGLVRWDLAVDWAIPREGLTLVKDRRLYEEMRHSDSDRTQYLGQRNTSGRVKLYNKQAEQKLADPLSRLEITVDMEDSTPERVAALWPTVYSECGTQGGLVSGLADTDRFILRTLLDTPERMGELGRKKREKMALLLEAARTPLAFDSAAFMDVLAQISAFLWGGDGYQLVWLDMDSSPFDESRNDCEQTTI